MKFNTKLALLALFICITTNANAITRMGAISCGEWVASQANTASIAQQYWLSGFLSGMAAGTQEDVLYGVSGESLTLWVDNYCQANPLENTFSAGILLFMELKKQKGLK